MKYLILFLLCVSTMQTAYSKKPDYQCQGTDNIQKCGTKGCGENVYNTPLFTLTVTTYDEYNRPSEPVIYDDDFYSMKECLDCVKRLSKGRKCLGPGFH